MDCLDLVDVFAVTYKIHTTGTLLHFVWGHLGTLKDLAKKDTFTDFKHSKNILAYLVVNEGVMTFLMMWR